MADPTPAASCLAPTLANRAPDSSQAVILNLQRLSTEDGPGIRTTVFFKGCPLSCAWCHNPESISPFLQIQWLKTRCIGCRTCLSVCKSDCLTFAPEGLLIDRLKCSLCLACSDACPAGAMEQVGKRAGLEELLEELVKDRSYYEASGGGVTASGGEPTLQAGFVRRLFAELKRAGIHTALDTCGLTQFSTLESLLPVTDLVLFDLKELDPVRHKAYTGSSNALILSNLEMLAAAIRRENLPTSIWVRTPLIPDATATPENLFAIGHFLHIHLGGQVERWELCAFNNLCADKYVRLGLAWPFAGSPLLEKRQADDLLRAARAGGFDPARIQVTGSFMP